MKKNFIYALLSATALTVLLGFSACSSNDEVVADPNPNFDPATNEVTTQFVFNVSNGNEPITRQSEEATQASAELAANKFRGIEDSYIMCAKQTADGNYLSTATTVDKAINMDKERFLRLKKDEIVPWIEEEIAVRYYFQEAGIKVRLRYDSQLKEALQKPLVKF